MTSAHEEQRDRDPVAEYIDERMPELIDRLASWVSVPSVAGDPQHRIDLVRSAHWIAGEMRDAGFDVSMLPTEESCTVIGRWIVDDDAPTVLVYSHHDVRPVKPELWTQTAPFVPVERDGLLYGRGASDAKGQVLAHVWAARAHRAASEASERQVNLILLIDGEEEIGSPGLADLLDAHRDALACDVIVFSDTLQWDADIPAAVTSMRGVVTATLTVTGPDVDLHSGAASGITVNPALALSTVLGRLQDETGRIAIPGFYDDVQPLGPDRRRELAAVPFDEDQWAARMGARAVVGEAGYTPLERLWARPAVEIIALAAGDQGLSRSVIPSEATATLSIRTVPGQRIPAVADQLREFVAREMPEGAAYSLTVEESLGQEPYVSPDGPVLEALERALERGFGAPVQGRLGNAGGGPADLLSSRFGAPVYFVGTGLPEDSWHSGNESIDLGMLRRGAASLAYLWAELGQWNPRESEPSAADVKTLSTDESAS